MKLLFRILITLYYRTGLYRLWSSLYRRMHEHQFRDIVLPLFSSLSMLGQLLAANADKWRPDSGSELWDACSYPGKAWLVFRGEFKPTSGFDCDEFAIFIANVVKKSVDRYVLDDSVVNPRMLTVTWLLNGRPDGHNVCLLEHVDYGKHTFSYMDYGQPSRRRGTIQEVVDDIRAQRAPSAEALTWMLADPDLKPLEIHWS